MTPEQEKYIHLYENMVTLCSEQKWGDPFSYARGKEIFASFSLGHSVSNGWKGGGDAVNKKGKEVEYKSTTQKKVQGSYTGISVQPTWQEQVRYLKEEKIAKYPEHYYNRFENGKLVESWMLPGEKVLELLLPKLERKFSTVLQKKDPRLSATVTTREILTHGKRVI